MTYISGGDLVAKRSPWRVSIVSDLFWGVVNFFGVFVSSIFADPGTLRSSGGRSNGNGNGYGGGSGGNNGPRRPIGTIRSRETINQPMGGCGSCCG
ncbi:hypothetical protein Poli38472_013625 [Pythium oligandrum]|uniref:Selenoprotein K n=1 Tax=Pythium oligandrum TaxID=41045 RepID=A0A8K1CDB6_PYTOL|nr:hypothetical protein Poli38472_013625 [Pythium oligandrum]|eukprot:TMW61162.1 hypothetical protein Poli38472_013625 [Pythium oligandrum]